jgi:ZIP family zinc transporter
VNNVDPIVLAFLLCLFAGLATGIGSIIAATIKQLKTTYLTIGLGLSAGVMLYISFVEMLPHAFENLGEGGGALAFFSGMLIMLIIDFLIPEEKNPHHFEDISSHSEQSQIQPQIKQQESINGSPAQPSPEQLKRTGILAMVAIIIHNFPEGIATFLAAYENIEWGIIIAVAVALHNIPEGISVTMPIIYATGDRKKGLWYGILSGFAEPLGAIIGFLLLRPFLTPAVLSAIMGMVAGIMVYISVDEIIPVAHTYSEGHYAIGGILVGMAIMALTLVLL